jgi:hypothetical protein
MMPPESVDDATSQQAARWRVEYDDADTPPEAITALWRGVLAQHIMDAKSRSNQPEKLYYRNQALSFLFDDSKDFALVCELADLNPERVRKDLLAARARGFMWRAEHLQDVLPAPKPKRRKRRRKKRISARLEGGLFTKLPIRPAPRAKRRSVHTHGGASHMQNIRKITGQLEMTF